MHAPASRERLRLRNGYDRFRAGYPRPLRWLRGEGQGRVASVPRRPKLPPQTAPVSAGRQEDRKQELREARQDRHRSVREAEAQRIGLDVDDAALEVSISAVLSAFSVIIPTSGLFRPECSKIGGARVGCRIGLGIITDCSKGPRSGRYRFDGRCEEVVLAIAFSFSLRSSCSSQRLRLSTNRSFAAAERQAYPSIASQAANPSIARASGPACNRCWLSEVEKGRSADMVFSSSRRHERERWREKTDRIIPEYRTLPFLSTR